MTLVTLYGKPGCCLCDEAREALEARIARDVDLLELERRACPDVVDDLLRLVAEAASRLSVERYERHPIQKERERRTTGAPPAVPRARTTKR